MKVKEYGVKIKKNGHNKLYVKEVYSYHLSKVDSPQHIYDLLKSSIHLDELAEEHIYMIALDTGSKILGIFEVSHGTVNGALSQPREILIRALLCGASMVVLAHNHPGQTLVPSKIDLQFTERIRNACELIGITLVDSLIITREKYAHITE